MVYLLIARYRICSASHFGVRTMWHNAALGKHGTQNGLADLIGHGPGCHRSSETDFDASRLSITYQLTCVDADRQRSSNGVGRQIGASCKDSRHRKAC